MKLLKELGIIIFNILLGFLLAVAILEILALIKRVL